MLNLESLLMQRPSHISTLLDGEVMLMNVETGCYCGLDQMGSFIWQQLAKPTSVRAVCEAIQKEFDVARERCEADGLEFLEGLMKCGFVVHAEPFQSVPE